MLWLALLLPVVLAVVVLLVVLATHVDDWSRDLTTNRAHTAPGERQEPWEIRGVTLEQATEAAVEFAQRQAKWELADEKPLPGDSPLTPLLDGLPPRTHHFVRTTGLVQYKDDVWLLVTSDADDTLRFFAESRSRVGKGDLGQNPRNLAELRGALVEAMSD